MKKGTIVLADNHKIVLEGLHHLLEGEFDVVGAVEDGQALLDLAEKLQPDVVIAEISLPSLSGIDTTVQLRKKNVRSKVILLTLHHDLMYMMRAFAAGVSGFVLKDTTINELIPAIQEVMNGRTYISPMLLERHWKSDKVPNRQEER